ncbi:MAG: type II toxin-antitoxin system HicB family antitoxin [Candidatus Firestonebacteria bacterium]
MKMYKLSVLIEKDEDNMFIAKVPDLQGCHSQAKTMQELLKKNTRGYTFMSGSKKA